MLAPDPASVVAAEVLAPAHTDWLRHELLVRGPAAAIRAFQDAAAGPGLIPWRYDFERMAEDWFLQLAGPADGERAISLQGARILARRLRDAAAANHARTLAQLGTERRCPFDLHRLVPVPPAILQLGPDEPASRAWLWANWGTTRALRHVRVLPVKEDRRRARPAQWRVELWSADWSPWQALRRLRHAWPDIGFDLRPDYAAGGDA